MENFTDLQLVKEIKNKNLTVYEYVIEKYTKQVFFLIYSILKNYCTKEDIEECVSDVFFNVWTSIIKFDPQKGSFKTWIFMLAKYKALSIKRKYTKENLVNIDDYIVFGKDEVEKTIIEREQQEIIIKELYTFNELDRNIFIKRYFYNEKIQNIMNDYNLSRSAIDNRLLRCRNKIKEVLKNERRRVEKNY